MKYLTLIKNIRDNDADLFEKIKRLLKKGRSAKSKSELSGSLVTYFRKGKVQKFFKAGNELQADELDFISAAEILESEADEKRRNCPKLILTC